MAGRQCDYCGKGVQFANLVSHAKNRSRKVRKPNLHTVKVVEDGEVVKRTLCAKCIKKATRPYEAKKSKK